MMARVKTKSGEGYLEFPAGWPEPSLPGEVKPRVNGAVTRRSSTAQKETSTR